MEKEITVCGRTVKFKATALAPRLYRFKFGRDIFKDFADLSVPLSLYSYHSFAERELLFDFLGDGKLSLEIHIHKLHLFRKNKNVPVIIQGRKNTCSHSASHIPHGLCLVDFATAGKFHGSLKASAM